MSADDLASELDRLPAPQPPRIRSRRISDIVAERREPRWILPKILEEYVLAVMAGSRGSFKSFIALHWAMLAAVREYPVLLLSGEGAGLDRRVDAWMRVHGAGVDLTALPFEAIEMPLRLTAGGDLRDLVALIEAGQIITPRLIVIDTMSKYSAGLDENSNADVADFLSSLTVELRDRFNSTVLLVAHTGHGESKRPRGAYALMANPDCEFIVERAASPAMTVTVSRERFKDCAALQPLAYAADVIDLGRFDSHGDRVTSLALNSTAAPDPRPKLAGKHQMAAWTALREWSRKSPDARHVTTIELHDLLKAHGVNRQRKLDVINSLINSRAVTAAVGGYTLDPEVLKR